MGSLLTLLVVVAAPDCAEISRANLVACAQAQSPRLLAEQASVRASEGRRDAAKPFLPTNPVLSGSLASRTGPDARTFNWYLTLEQQLEIAGQSVLRTEAAEKELAAQQHQLAVARAEVAEQVWRAYFEALAAQERAALAAQLDAQAQAVALTVQGMERHGLASPVDTSVADAAAVRAGQRRLEAEQEARATQAQLGALLGVPEPQVSGLLEPLRGGEQPGRQRPERLALTALREASSQRIEVLRRERAPNPTVSVFAQNDGFNELVFGAGVGLPIPLPQPVGRTNAGQIAEAVALEARAQADLLQLERTLAAEQALARSELDSRQRARALYTPERVTRARQGLEALATQLNAGRLSVREALTSQQALVELLQADVEARLALCLASVRWLRANGLSLEGASL